MMDDVGKAEIGATVYPYSGAKTAPSICYLGLAAVLVSKEEWPYLTVRVFTDPDNPLGEEHRIHRLNIRMTRKTAASRDRQGDTVGDGGKDATVGMVGKPIGRPVPPIDPAYGEQDVLF